MDMPVMLTLVFECVEYVKLHLLSPSPPPALLTTDSWSWLKQYSLPDMPSTMATFLPLDSIRKNTCWYTPHSGMGTLGYRLRTTLSGPTRSMGGGMGPLVTRRWAAVVPCSPTPLIRCLVMARSDIIRCDDVIFPDRADKRQLGGRE